MEMAGSRAYVVWRDAKAAQLRSGVFDIASYKASSIKPLAPPPPAGARAAPHGGVTAMAAAPGGRLTFKAWLPLPAGPAPRLPLLWALGDGWSLPVQEAAQHFDRSGAATYIDVAPPRAAAPRKAVARPPGCALAQQFELQRLGDGWCDELAPYNSPECLFDGGDCCNPKAPFYDCRDPKSPLFGKASRRGLVLPAPRNPRYSEGLGRVLSTRELVTTYNNFYEFSTDKDAFDFVTPAARAAMEVADPGFSGWTITVDGLVAKPMKVDVRDLIKMFHPEERVYRHRCVEAWAIVVPWIGFPLRKLLATVKPLPGAKYIRFETDKGSYMPNAQTASISPGAPLWPYAEGLAIEEAWNDLAFLSIGLFNGTMPSQSGAPIRLNVPWKYGFKSVKSLRKISFVAERPGTYWNEFAPDEYGWWANINPDVPHPRWSQAVEQELVTSPRPRGTIRTTIFNNYTSEVAHMYGTDRTFFF
ncbi:MAG: Oxidoreductase, molybdopterin-binding domain-containing protein [Monoraphidium minutum]|nr:MAG: Oxidoreductase, molybdopterin-binding domain-containing protein [Monoraphidium minutum]